MIQLPSKSQTRPVAASPSEKDFQSSNSIHPSNTEGRRSNACGPPFVDFSLISRTPLAVRRCPLRSPSICALPVHWAFPSPTDYPLFFLDLFQYKIPIKSQQTAITRYPIAFLALHPSPIGTAAKRNPHEITQLIMAIALLFFIKPPYLLTFRLSIESSISC